MQQQTLIVIREVYCAYASLLLSRICFSKNCVQLSSWLPPNSMIFIDFFIKTKYYLQTLL